MIRPDWSAQPATPTAPVAARVATAPAATRRRNAVPPSAVRPTRRVARKAGNPLLAVRAVAIRATTRSSQTVSWPAARPTSAGPASTTQSGSVPRPLR